MGKCLTESDMLFLTYRLDLPSEKRISKGKIILKYHH